MDTKTLTITVGTQSFDLELHKDAEDADGYVTEILLNGIKYELLQIPKTIYMNDYGFIDEDYEPEEDANGNCFMILAPNAIEDLSL